MEGVVSMIPNREFKLSELSKINSSASEIDLSVLKNLFSSPSLDMNNYSSIHTITSDATLPSIVGLTLLNDTLNGFKTTITCNCTAGSKILTNVSSLSKLFVGQYLKQSSTSANLSNNIAVGSKIVSIDALNNTVTINKDCLATGIAINVFCTLYGIKYIGGVPWGYGNSLAVTASTVTKSSPSAYLCPYAIEFMTDAANFSTSTYSIIIRSYRNGKTPNSFRVAIDDVYDTVDLVPYLGSDTGFIKIQFNTEGVHKVRIEFPGGRLLQGIYVIGGASIWEPEEKNKVIFFGDSWFAGTTTDTLWGFDNIAYRIANGLGVDIVNSSVGGTGYIYEGGVNFNWRSSYRLDDILIADSVKAIILFGTINDSGNTKETISEASLYVFQQIRNRLPNIPIFIIGIARTVLVTKENTSILESGLKDAFDIFNDSNSYFIPISTSDTEKIINDNNIDKYIGADGNHLTNIGAKYVSNRLIMEVKNIIANQTS